MILELKPTTHDPSRFQALFSTSPSSFQVLFSCAIRRITINVEDGCLSVFYQKQIQLVAESNPFCDHLCYLLLIRKIIK